MFCFAPTTTPALLKAPRIHFFSLDSYPYQFGSDATRLHETIMGLHPNGITFKSEPVWVRIVDPGSDP